jgi:hypothetical protein
VRERERESRERENIMREREIEVAQSASKLVQTEGDAERDVACGVESFGRKQQAALSPRNLRDGLDSN